MKNTKLTPKIVRELIAKKREGLSLRELATWVSANHGFQISHVAVRGALQRRGRLDRVERKATQPQPAKAVESPPRATPPPSQASPPTEAEPEPEPAPPEPEIVSALDDLAGLSDIDALDAAIRGNDRDIEGARVVGAMQSVAALSRLRAALVARRRRLRAELSPETQAPSADVVASGARAWDKLASLARTGKAA